MSDTYIAKFTLIQEGLAGMVTPKLEFLPRVDPTKEEVPAIYEYLSNIALDFIRTAGIIDENNEIVDEEAFDRVELDLTGKGRATH